MAFGDGKSPGVALSDSDISAVSLPPSLFEMLQMKTQNNGFGLVFTSYSNAVLFPIAGLDPNSSTATIVGSSVISATVSGHPVQGLPDPIVVKHRVDKLKVGSHLSILSL